MPATAPLDTTIEVVTPENIAFEYQLAGPFRRLPAYLIDVAIRWLVIFLMVVGLILTGAAAGVQVVQSFLFAAGLVAYFLISWFYGVLLETYFNGRTIGKWACGLRVISTDGRPINGYKALVRNLLRIADLMPLAALAQFDPDIPPQMIIPTGVVGLVAVTCTRRMQRLGDLAAGTMVVVDEKSWQLRIAKVDDVRVPALASFIPGDYRVSPTMARTLATYAERRAYLTPARRREVARHVADPLIDRFEFRNDVDPDLLLYALYYRTFLVDERSEPPDLGPLAGFSPLRRDTPDDPENPPTAADSGPDRGVYDAPAVDDAALATTVASSTRGPQP